MTKYLVYGFIAAATLAAIMEVEAQTCVGAGNVLDCTKVEIPTPMFGKPDVYHHTLPSHTWEPVIEPTGPTGGWGYGSPGTARSVITESKAHTDAFIAEVNAIRDSALGRMDELGFADYDGEKPSADFPLVTDTEGLK